MIEDPEEILPVEDHFVEGEEPQDEETTNEEPSAETTSPPADSDAEERKPYNPLLKRGSQSGYVRKFQAMLRNAFGCDVTGIFDRQTEMKVLQFQREHKLEQTGEADEATWTKLRELSQA